MTRHRLPERPNQRQQRDEGRDTASLQAAWRADADQPPHEQAEVEATGVNQQTLPNIDVAAEIHAAQAAGLVEMGERPFQSLAAKPQQAEAPRAANAPTIAVHRVARRRITLVARCVSRFARRERSQPERRHESCFDRFDDRACARSLDDRQRQPADREDLVRPERVVARARHVIHVDDIGKITAIPEPVSNCRAATRERFRGRDAVLSGPAGGVVAVAEIGRQTGVERLIGFDMGGTSTDVCRVERGEPEQAFETEVAGVRLKTPMLRVHTVAAGGGSICRYDAGRLTVGPRSAGAMPGPLVYGHPDARELTLTDVNVALGRVAPDRFPLPLDESRAHRALEAIARELSAEGAPRSPLSIAEGFFRVAVENMAEAIRTVSIARGHDPRDDALVAFGGAGGQHACAVARALGITRIFFHPLAGVLSAYGIGVAPTAWHGEADCGRVPLDDGSLGGACAASGRFSGNTKRTAIRAPEARMMPERAIAIRRSRFAMRDFRSRMVGSSIASVSRTFA